MTAKFGKVVTYCRKTTPTKSRDLSTIWSRDKYKHNICTSATPMVTKLDRVVTCGGGTPTSKSRDLLITWTHHI